MVLSVHNTGSCEKIDVSTQFTIRTSSNSVFDTKKANINGEIEGFRQMFSQDCALLAEISGLSHKKWGKQILKNAISSDGKGGAIITLNGAVGKQKEFRVTLEEILLAREKQQNDFRNAKYSIGDDDVLVLEMAIEKYLKTQGRETLDAVNINLVDLLACNSNRVSYNKPDSFWEGDDCIIALEELEKNLDNYVIFVGFSKDNNGGFAPIHAYELKNIKTASCGHKVVTLVNPINNMIEKDVDYYTFIKSLDSIQCLSKPGKIAQKINSKISYEEFEKKSLKYENHKNHQQCLINLEYEQISNDFTKIIYADDKEKRKIDLQSYLTQSNDAKTINYLKFNISDLITKIDNTEWGWGKGKNKKELMTPLIDYVISQAEWNHVDENEINEFKEKCYKELDAWFYTDEKKIIEAFDSILQKL